MVRGALVVWAALALCLACAEGGGAGAAGLCVTGGTAGMRLRGGASAQMAEVRARLAAKFEEEMAKEKAGAAEEDPGDGERVWCYADDKVGPETVRTREMEMAQGDARNYYFEGGVTVLRNRNTGMTLELLHDSPGWFNFCAMEGAKLKEISTAGDVCGVTRWYVPGVIETMKNNPIKVSSLTPKGHRAGNWKIEAAGGAMVISNPYAKGKTLHLTDDGFYYLNEPLGEAISVGLDSEPERMPLADAKEALKSA